MKTSKKNSSPVKLQGKENLDTKHSETIKELEDQLFELNEKLKDSEALKSHFISNVTNEIVNPFTAIMGLSDQIIGLHDNEIGKARKMAHMIHSEAFALNFQLNNIFAAAKIEAGEVIPEISGFNIKTVIDSAIQPFESEARTKDIHIIIEYDLEDDTTHQRDFYSDPEKIKLILSNLISNAIKYSPPHAQVLVKIYRQKEQLKVSVSDSGNGFNDSDRQIIFDRFKQLNTRINSINKGYGLGLSLVKALVDLLEGSIEIISEKENRTEFMVEFKNLKQSCQNDAFEKDFMLLDNDGIF